jgi:isopenicillin-N epimerase
VAVNPTPEVEMTPFGRALLDLWPLDPSITYLNHGTVGVVPRRVLAVQAAIRAEMERQPATFLFRDANHLEGRAVSERPRMRAAADELGGRMGARGDDLAWVDNATAGVNAVLRSLDWREGDEVLVTDHSYGAVTLAARGILRTFGAVVREVALPDPAIAPGPVAEAIVGALGPRTRLAILDHVTSGSALVLPIAELAARCRARGVAVLVDGAHAPGALPLHLGTIGADWYTGNLHKWALAPRSCGMLWAAPGRQPGLHPPVLSWGLDQGFTAEFDWVGTRDPSPWLAAPEGFHMLDDLGLDAVREHNHALAWHGARAIAARLGTRFDVAESMVGCMATLPLPAAFGSTREDGAKLRDALLFDHRIEVPVMLLKDRLWLRLSAQAYNEEADIARLADALAVLG